jgi:hypothetical protein
MFIGHFGLAFAAKRLAPGTGLGALGAASQWVDLVWPVLLLAGVEQVRIAPGDTAYTSLAFVHYPWTHGLLMSVAWGTLSMWLLVLWMAWVDRLRQPSGLAVGAVPGVSGPP